jgi:hypothetical protein
MTETLNKLRDYSFAICGVEAAAYSNAPILNVKATRFGPCVSGGLLTFEPIGSDWDSLYAAVDRRSRDFHSRGRSLDLDESVAFIKMYLQSCQ